MHKLPVTFVLDRRASPARMVPATTASGTCRSSEWCRPADRRSRDAATLREELREAVAVDNGPTVVRFPTGAVAADLPALRRVGPVDVLAESARTDVLLVAVGSFGQLGMEVAARVAEQGYGVTVVDPRWVRRSGGAGRPGRPSPPRGQRRGRRPGRRVGDALAQAMRDADVRVPLRTWACRPTGTRTAPARRSSPIWA
ncbi:transketolase C-terminal domain-containing protein [Micromonospora sp. M12]